MNRSTFRHPVSCYPKGSSPLVVMHGARRLLRGRNPSKRYKAFKDPVAALKVADRDATFYRLIELADDDIEMVRDNSRIEVSPREQPLTWHFVRHLRINAGLVCEQNDGALEIEQFLLFALVDRLAERQSVDLCSLYEYILDNYYRIFDEFIVDWQDQYELELSYDATMATDEAFTELILLMKRILDTVDFELNRSCVAPAQLEQTVTLN